MWAAGFCDDALPILMEEQQHQLVPFPSALVAALLSLTNCIALALCSNHAPEDFCYVNNFQNSQPHFFQPLLHIENLGEITEEEFYSHLEWGRPFVVHGVTKGWRANEKWDVNYFRQAFSEFELFSSTFSTNASPVFEDSLQEDVYFGIFLNNAELARHLAMDYNYPCFIPTQLQMQGRQFS